MNMLNTKATKHQPALTQAIFTLQTLSDSLSVAILDFLLENGESTLLDLTITLQMDTSTLEMQVDLLCQTKVVRLNSDLYSNWYQIDYQRLEQVNGIARQLVNSSC